MAMHGILGIGLKEGTKQRLMGALAHCKPGCGKGYASLVTFPKEGWEAALEAQMAVDGQGNVTLSLTKAHLSD